MADCCAASVVMSQLPLMAGDERHDTRSFPRGYFDVHRQQLDLRQHNSWRMRLHEVPITEMVECQAVNAVAPFIINSRLKPLMMITPGVRCCRCYDAVRWFSAADIFGFVFRVGQVHCECECDGGQVLPLQDPVPSAHQYGQGVAQYDDTHCSTGLRQRQYLHDRRRHGALCALFANRRARYRLAAVLCAVTDLFVLVACVRAG